MRRARASPSPDSPSPKMMPTHTDKAGATSSATHHSHPHKLNVTDFTIPIPGSERKATDEPPKSRWRTPEFYFYYFLFVIVVPIMVYIPMKLSSYRNSNYINYGYLLSPGWMYGRRVDVSDVQFRTFRSNIGVLSLLAIGYLVPSHLLRKLGYTSAPARALFISVFAVGMLFGLHGWSVIKILAILILNYVAVKARKPPLLEKLWPGVIICVNMGLLLLSRKLDGYHFSAIHASLGALDSMDGMLSWEISFNFSVLRIISFALDYHWRNVPPATAPADYRSRVNQSHPEEEYNLLYYLAYVLYPPTYIAGPIMTFNDFVWQLRHPVQISLREQVSYLVRFAGCMLTLESILHTMYVTAIQKTRAWQGASAADLSMIGFWNLVIVWLKLLIPWRFFRLWALLDGMDPPENMVRCVANNYSTLGFWRSWHRSYNLWTVRYIYIPLGGAKRVFLSTVLVFTFVALWHDLSWQLLAWGWLVAGFVLPEIIGRALVPASKYGQKWWYRHVAAFGGALNVLLMMTANLVGFVLGLDGVKYLISTLLGTASGLSTLVISIACLFVAVQVMFEYREEEARRGIDRRC